MKLVTHTQQQLEAFKPQGGLTTGSESYRYALVSLNKMLGVIAKIMSAGPILPEELDPRDAATVGRVKSFVEWVSKLQPWDQGVSIPFQEVYQVVGRPDSTDPVDRALRSCLTSCERGADGKTRYLLRTAHFWGLLIVLHQHEAYHAARSIALQDAEEAKLAAIQKVERAFDPDRVFEEMFKPGQQKLT